MITELNQRRPEKATLMRGLMILDRMVKNRYGNLTIFVYGLPADEHDLEDIMERVDDIEENCFSGVRFDENTREQARKAYTEFALYAEARDNSQRNNAA